MRPTRFEISKTVACVMGLAVMLFGLLGFLPNPLIGPEGFFRTNAVLNFIIMGHAAALLFFATRDAETALQGLYLVAVSALAFGWFFSTHLVHQPAGQEVTLYNVVVCSREDVWLLVGMATILAAFGQLEKLSQRFLRY